MLDLKAQLGDYLDHVVQRVEVEDVLEERFGPEPVRPIRPRVPSRRTPGWVYGVAAAVVVLLLVGGVAWLSQRGGVPPADAPTTTIATETTVPTDTSVPTDSSVPPTDATTTTTIEATEAALPPGEGPKLEFVQVQLPEAVELGTGRRSSVWFQGALHVIGRSEGELFRSVDGITWDLLPGFPAGSELRREQLKTDGVRLVSAGSPVPPLGSGYCIGSDAFFEVNTSTNGVDWTSSKIPLPVPEEANGAGCFSADVGEIAAGPQGIIVTGSISLQIGGGFGSGLIEPDDRIHVETTVDLDRGVIVAEFFNEPDMEPTGEIVEISLDDAGFTELFSYMESDPGWEPLIEPLLQEMTAGSPEPGVLRGLAWFSPDAMTWRALDPGGPLQGGVEDRAGISEIEATPDGFIATSGCRLWETTDGTAWKEGTLLRERPQMWRLCQFAVWDGTPISVSNQGVWTIEDTPQELMPGIGVNDMVYWVGDFGFVGLVPEYGGGAAADEILFSEDGTTWNRWNPTEIVPEAGLLRVVGIADDFIVLQQGLAGRDQLVVWVGTLP